MPPTSPIESNGTASRSVTQSLPNQVALIHSTSEYSSWKSSPSSACTNMRSPSATVSSGAMFLEAINPRKMLPALNRSIGETLG